MRRVALAVYQTGRGGAIAVIFFFFGISLQAAYAGDFSLGVASRGGHANGEPLVMPDCVGSRLTISPCVPVALTWLNYLNSRAYAFVQAYQAAGFSDTVRSAVLDCSAGIYNPRKTRKGIRSSRHAYAEACDGSKITVNGRTFSYARAVRDAGSDDRRFFTAFLDAWGTVGPGCVPDKGYTIMGVNVGCRPMMADNCGVIDWRERGRNSQYASTYHLSYCLYTDPSRAYE